MLRNNLDGCEVRRGSEQFFPFPYQELGRQEQGGDTAYVVMEIVLGQSLLPVFPLFLGGDCLVGELTSGNDAGLIV